MAHSASLLNNTSRKPFHVGLVAIFYAICFVGPVKSIGPFALLLGLAIIDLVIDVDEAVEHLLLALVSVLGVIPIFGWYSFPSWVSPLHLVIAIWATHILFRLETTKLRRSLEAVTLLPGIVVSYVTYLWWSPLSKGNPVVVLGRLLPIWDLSAHFLFFYSNLKSRVYIPFQSSQGEQTIWEGREYPTGIHFVWAEFARNVRDKVVLKPETAIPVFANSVILTFAIAVGVIIICVWRLGRTPYQRFYYSVIGSGVAIALVVVGPICQTISTGFANMSAVVIGIVILVSTFLRPVSNVKLQLFLISGALSTIAYNWYPVLLVVVPLVVFQLLRELRNHHRRYVIVMVIFTAVVCTPPLIQTASLGVKHLEIPGGVQSFPHGPLVAILLASFAMGVWSICNKGYLKYAVLNFPPLILALILALRLRTVTGTYPYYFHKAALFVATYTVMALVMTLISLHQEKFNYAIRRPLRSQLALGLASVVLGLSISQSLGYWGPDYPTFSAGSTAYGVLMRNEAVRDKTEIEPTTRIIINEARNVQNLPLAKRKCLTLFIPDRVGIAEGATANNSYKDTLANVWFHALTSSYTFEAKEQAYMTNNVASSLSDELLMVDEISAKFDPQSVCIFSSSIVTRELVSRRDVWRVRPFASNIFEFNNP